MSDTDFDTALVAAAFHLAAGQGWHRVTPAAAAREAGLPLAEARIRFPSKAMILVRFGQLADQAVLADAPSEGSVRDRLFDMLMRRFDVMQTNRAGIKALLRFVPTHPPTALLLALATKRSMRWMLQAAGVTATGLRGEVQVRGLLAVWLWGIRAWERDESDDLSGTMAAIDTALTRAEQAASWLHGRRPDATSEDAGFDETTEPAPPDPSTAEPSAPNPSKTEPEA